MDATNCSTDGWGTLMKYPRDRSRPVRCILSVYFIMSGWVGVVMISRGLGISVFLSSWIFLV